MELNFLENGRNYKINEHHLNFYSEDVFKILNHLGLIKYKSKKRFYVTPLVNALFKPNLFLTKVDKIFFIETNFRIYVYSSKTANKAIIFILNKLIGDYEYEFEDNEDIKKIQVINTANESLLIGDLKRSSLIEIFKRGLSSEQIINFLRTYSKNGLISNIEQQLKIWEREVNVIAPVSCIYLCDFNNESDYLNFMNKVRENKIQCLWRNDSKMACCFHAKAKEIIERICR
jgi:hypothetical protein